MFAHDAPLTDAARVNEADMARTYRTARKASRAFPCEVNADV